MLKLYLIALALIPNLFFFSKLLTCGQISTLSSPPPPAQRSSKLLIDFRLSKVLSFSFDAKVEHSGSDAKGKFKWIEGMSYSVKAVRPSSVRIDDITPIRRLKQGEEILLSNRNFLRANGKSTLEGHTRLKKYELHPGNPKIADLKLQIVQEIHGDILFIKDFDKEFDYYYDSTVFEDGVKVNKYVYEFGSPATGKGRSILFIDAKTNLPFREVDLEQDTANKWIQIDRVTYSNWSLNPLLPPVLFDPSPPSEFDAAPLELPGFDPSLTPGNTPSTINTKDIKGETISLKDYTGKIVLIDFWATWCGPCLSELSELKALLKKHGSSGFDIIGVSMDDTSELANLKMALKDNDINWRQICDGKGFKGPMSTPYKVNAIPFNLIIGRDGKIAAVNKHGRELEDAIILNLKK